MEAGAEWVSRKFQYQLLSRSDEVINDKAERSV